MKLDLKRTFSTGLAAVYFATNVALSSAAQTSFWEQRRQGAPALNALATSLSDSARLLDRLPSTSRVSAVSPTVPASLRGVIRAIPVANGTIQELFYSGDAHQPIVTLIQDVHMNVEAQRHIAAVLRALIDARQTAFIGVEGAFGPFDFSFFQKFPEPRITAQTAEQFLNEARLAAPSYVGLTAQQKIPLMYGIDDPRHYHANVQAYRDAIDIKDDSTRKLSQFRNELTADKATVFSSALRRFDERRAAYHSGAIGFGAYVEELTLSRSNLDPTIARFIEAYAIERRLDFDRVERERRVVVEKLSRTLTNDGVQTLLANSAAYRDGHMSFGDYYQELRVLCLNNGVVLSSTPAFEAYIRYALLADGIKATALIDAVDNLERQTLAALITSPAQQQLAQCSEQLMLAEKLTEFSLTPTEWERYQRLKTENGKWEIDRGEIYISNLSAFEKFYSEADVRSSKMIGTALSVSGGGDKVIVVGGFHTPDITRQLREQRVSYVVVSPKISKVDGLNGSAYLSVFAREKTPLDRLFAGKKLFLAPEMAQIKHPETYRAFLSRMSGFVSGRAGLLLKWEWLRSAWKSGDDRQQGGLLYSLWEQRADGSTIEEYARDAWKLETWNMYANGRLLLAAGTISALGALFLGWNLATAHTVANAAVWTWFFIRHIDDQRRNAKRNADRRAPRINLLWSFVVTAVNTALPLFITELTGTTPLVVLLLSLPITFTGSFAVHRAVNAMAGVRRNSGGDAADRFFKKFDRGQIAYFYAVRDAAHDGDRPSVLALIKLDRSFNAAMNDLMII